MWVDFPILDPYSSYMALPMWVQHGTLLQITHESLMGCPCRTHINTHLGPMWVLYFLLAEGLPMHWPLLLEVKTRKSQVTNTVFTQNTMLHTGFRRSRIKNIDCDELMTRLWRLLCNDNNILSTKSRGHSTFWHATREYMTRGHHFLHDCTCAQGILRLACASRLSDQSLYRA